MIKKTTVISALTILTAQVGMTTTAQAQDSLRWEWRCDYIRQFDDVATLQRQLEFLLLNHPDDPCIGFLVRRLGQAPLGQVVGAQPPY